MATSIICQGLYHSENDNNPRLLCCPIRDDCYRYHQRNQTKEVEEKLLGPYDPETNSCNMLQTIGKK